MNTIKKHVILFYVVLTYIFSWIFWLPLVVFELSGITKNIMMILGGYGPFFAAILIIGIIKGKKAILSWMKDIFVFQSKVRNYLLALIIPLVIGFFAIVIINLTNQLTWDYSLIAPWWAYPIFLLYIIFLGGGQEEPGWRGFLLPRLLKNHSSLIASLIIGLIWAFWHTPLFFMKDSVQQTIPFVWYFINTLAFSIILTKVYLKSYSIIPVIILHAGLNAIGNYVPFQEGIGSIFPYLTVVSWIVALILIFSSNNDIAEYKIADN